MLGVLETVPIHVAGPEPKLSTDLPSKIPFLNSILWTPNPVLFSRKRSTFPEPIIEGSKTSLDLGRRNAYGF